MLKHLFRLLSPPTQPGRQTEEEIESVARATDAEATVEHQDSALDDRLIDRLYVRNQFRMLDHNLTKLSSAESSWIQQRKKELKSDDAAWTRMVPRLPTVVPRLLAATRDSEKTPARELANMIASDPVLAANLLKVVNSPALRLRPEPIQSLEQAVVIVGTRGIREAVSAAFVSPIANFEADPRLNISAVNQLWPNALGVGVHLRRAAESSNIGQGFELFLAGMTHSTGLIVLLRRLDTLDQPFVSIPFTNAFEDLSRHYTLAAVTDWKLPAATMAVLTSWSKREDSPMSFLLSRAIAGVRQASLELQK